MTTLEYKGYQGSIEVDAETDVLCGKILFVTDLVTYEAKTIAALRKQFHAAVDDYLDTCQQLGRDPQQPFSGVFNVRVGPALHKAAAIRAQRDGVKLNAVLVNALQQYLTDTTVKHAHTHDHTVTVNVVAQSELKRIEPGTYSTHQPKQFEVQTHVH